MATPITITFERGDATHADVEFTQEEARNLAGFLRQHAPLAPISSVVGQVLDALEFALHASPEVDLPKGVGNTMGYGGDLMDGGH